MDATNEWNQQVIAHLKAALSLSAPSRPFELFFICDQLGAILPDSTEPRGAADPTDASATIKALLNASPVPPPPTSILRESN